MPVVIIKNDVRSREKPCLRCGYSLRKINDSNHCPECGLSVWLSLNQNDTLEMSNPVWLRRMALGLCIMAAANLLAAIAFVPASLQTFRVMQYRQRILEARQEARQFPDDPKRWSAIFATPPPKPDYTLQRAMLLVGAAALVAYHVGLFTLTSDEGRYPDKLAGLRLGARVVCASAALVLLLVGLNVMRKLPPGFPEWLTRLTAVAGAILTWGYLRQIARRMPNKTLTRLFAWMTLAPLLSLAYSFIRDSDWPPDVLPLAYFPVSLALFVWFAILLKRTAGQADSGWASETAMTR